MRAYEMDMGVLVEEIVDYTHEAQRRETSSRAERASGRRGRNDRSPNATHGPDSRLLAVLAFWKYTIFHRS